MTSENVEESQQYVVTWEEVRNKNLVLLLLVIDC